MRTINHLLIVSMLCSISLVGCVGQVRPDVQAVSSVVHGAPGLRPFWNAHSSRYIYAPSIAWVDTTTTVAVYHLDVNGIALSTSEAWVNLSDNWGKLEIGQVRIRIRGETATGDLAFSDSLEIIKSPGFESVGTADVTDVRENGLRGLEAVLKLRTVQHWLDPGGPDPEYSLWVHPSKLMGMLAQNMLFLSQTSTDPVIKEQALRVSGEAATFLLRLREPVGSPLAGWTHTYWDGVERGDHPIWMDQIMTLYPAEAALAFLDLFDSSSDSTWFVAARDIAETYAATQRDDGTWPLLMRRVDGTPVGTKLLIPVSVINFLDRLSSQYEIAEYASVREGAFEWIMANPVVTFDWGGQFEDTRPKQRYRNLSQRPAARLARLLYRTSEDPDELLLADQLLLFVEDQFIVWDHSDPVTQRDWFREGLKWNGNRTDGSLGKDWFLPAVLEQYAFYTPIAWATANLIYTYCDGFDATGNDLYREKARALSQSLVTAQAFHESGEIPTHLREVLPEPNWLNNSTYSARALVDATCL